ncbi:uncharacterized protein [Cherax quadricarinatus]|uniref:uncharacterized protein n=1 Tax=Cherax quadricarinatus TaxID=27406 RepID=UPI00387E9F0E
MLRNEPDTVTVNLTKCLEVNTHRSKWIVKTCNCIKFYNLHELYHCRQQEHFTPPWKMRSFNITYLQVPPKKLIASNPFLKSLVRATAQEEIFRLAGSNKLSQVIYTDGSKQESSGRAASALVATSLVKNDNKFVELGIRINNWASTLQTELFAILMALKLTYDTELDSIIITDSMSSLKALGSYNDSNNMLIGEARYRYSKIRDKGINVQLLWIPSHIGLLLHDKVDMLAKKSIQKENVEYNFGITVSSIRNNIRREVNNEDDCYRNAVRSLSRSITHYDNMNVDKYVYGATCNVNRLTDVVVARLRLGYKLFWQFGRHTDDDQTKCKLCDQVYGHSLEHYVLNCPLIEEYRDRQYNNLCDMSRYLINENKIPDILSKFPKFACNR